MACGVRLGKMDEQKIKIRDRQTLPFLMLPKLFFTRYSPTWKATQAFVALKYYASNEAAACQNISIRTLAKIVNVSEDTIKRGLAELEKKGIVKIRKRSTRSSKGERIPLPNLYELVNLEGIDGEPI
jgi:predicted HTH transcriptional regulator